jgi:hypothetical protein
LGLSSMEISSPLVNFQTPIPFLRYTPSITITNMMVFDNSFSGLSAGSRAAYLAHEAYHIFEGNPGTTIEEEAQAFINEFSVGSAFGLKYTTDAIPYNISQLTKGADYLDNAERVMKKLAKGRTGEVYKVAPQQQSQMRQSDLANELMALGGVGWIPSWVLTHTVRVSKP